MTSTEIAKYTTKAEARRIVGIIREHVPATKVNVDGCEINDFDIMAVRDKLNELVRDREISLKNWKAYDSCYDLVVEMIEDGVT